MNEPPTEEELEVIGLENEFEQLWLKTKKLEKKVKRIKAS